MNKTAITCLDPQMVYAIKPFSAIQPGQWFVFNYGNLTPKDALEACRAMLKVNENVAYFVDSNGDTGFEPISRNATENRCYVLALSNITVVPVFKN